MILKYERLRRKGKNSSILCKILDPPLGSTGLTQQHAHIHTRTQTTILCYLQLVAAQNTTTLKKPVECIPLCDIPFHLCIEIVHPSMLAKNGCQNENTLSIYLIYIAPFHRLVTYQKCFTSIICKYIIKIFTDK